MITLIYPSIPENGRFTELTRKKNRQWRWNPTDNFRGDQLKTLSSPIFTGKELKEYIQLFENIVLTTQQDGYKEKLFLEDYKFTFSRSEAYGTFYLNIYVKNKYLKDFKYGDEEVLATMQMDEWDDEYLGTPESWGGLSSAIDLTEESLQDYINQLIDEYEEVTGESYTPKN